MRDPMLTIMRVALRTLTYVNGHAAVTTDVEKKARLVVARAQCGRCGRIALLAAGLDTRTVRVSGTALDGACPQFTEFKQL